MLGAGMYPNLRCWESILNGDVPTKTQRWLRSGTQLALVKDEQGEMNQTRPTVGASTEVASKVSEMLQENKKHRKELSKTLHHIHKGDHAQESLLPDAGPGTLHEPATRAMEAAVSKSSDLDLAVSALQNFRENTSKTAAQPVGLGAATRPGTLHEQATRAVQAAVSALRNSKTTLPSAGQGDQASTQVMRANSDAELRA